MSRRRQARAPARASVRGRLLRPAALSIAALLAACSAEMNALDPSGPAAREIAGYWWVILVAGVAVFLLVMTVLGVALWRARPSAPGGPARLSSTKLIVAGGVLLPLVVLSVLMAFNLRTTTRLIALARGQAPVQVHVHGHRWWWEVTYTGYDFETANEIHIPVGRPVELRLTSADVIHSFWVPELNGKLDLIPGRTNVLQIQADRPGVYRGQCAEFCGLQHAKMGLLVIAQEPSGFEAWAQGQQEPADEPDTELTARGREVFLDASCVFCHTVRGTPADGDFGPDLTHIGARMTLAAATIPNNRGWMGGWISDPHSIKEGVAMPPTTFDSDELQALITYLQSLD